MGITSTQNLHYTDTTDAVEDHSTNIEVLARQLDARMRTHDVDTAAYGEGKPFCVLDAVAPQVLTQSTDPLTSMVHFDTVRVDTNGMAQLDVVDTAMFVPTLGYYRFGFYVVTPTSGCVVGTGSILWQIDNPVGAFSTVSLFGSRETQTTDANNGWVPGGGCSFLGKADASLQTWGWLSPQSIGTNCPAAITCTFARIWAYKVRDL